MLHSSSDHLILLIEADGNTQLSNSEIKFSESLSPAPPPKSKYGLAKQKQLND